MKDSVIGHSTEQAGEWRSIGDISAGIMGDLARERKLDLIRTLTAGEIEGWRQQLKLGTRAPFPGEMAALALREKQLGGRR